MVIQSFVEAPSLLIANAVQKIEFVIITEQRYVAFEAVNTEVSVFNVGLDIPNRLIAILCS